MRSIHPRLILFVVLFVPARAWADEGQPARYRQAPEEIRRILDAPPPPSVSLSPTRERMLLLHGVQYPPISDLAPPMRALAGHRINPRTNGPHRPTRYVAFTLMNVEDGKRQTVHVPKNGSLDQPLWSPDGEWFAFTNTLEDRIELWVGNAVSGCLSVPVEGLRINAAYGSPVQWMPDGSLLCQTVPEERGPPPENSPVPLGPNVQETSGGAGPVRTYQDLLKTPHDADLFDYYATSQLMLVDEGLSERTPVGQPAVIAHVDPAPDGEHLLVVTRRRPYSYLHRSSDFPTDVEVWNRSGDVVARLASLPLADQVPIGGVRTGPRNVRWRPTEPATLVWVEALDGGDPKAQVSHRDRLLTLSAPFDSDPIVVGDVEHRFAGITWGERDGLALLSDYDRDRRWTRTFLVNVDESATDGTLVDGTPWRLLWDRSALDRYGDPGTPVMRPLPSGRRVMWQQDNHILLTGSGATPQGDRPFLDRFDLETFETQRLFLCEEGCYEAVVAPIGDGSRFITRRESLLDPPNYLLRSFAEKEPRPLTQFTDPAPDLRGIHKELVTYQREDGVPLSFTLYLPADYQPGTRLPTIVWAYPREYNDPDTAGQVSGSPHRFTMIGGSSHLFLLTQGYAILDGATMPVIGDPETANDTYVEQIVASAKAAIDKAVELGVTDPDRVGIAGHSYGAFMTANLLAHSDLFQAGVARSGAFNRTLTPFGFQAERRMFWEAPETYFAVSPFMAAHKINQPLLLIHGEADDNAGTYPMQSERMYQAIRGNGGTARLVMLPCESHGYVARESVEHVLAETIDWFDRHVKQASPR